MHGEGDGQVNAEGPRYVCDKWKRVNCFDLKAWGPDGDHILMLWTRALADFVIGHVFDDAWKRAPSAGVGGEL
jgi:hypothetical protein